VVVSAQRRHALEDWMSRLLSDIDISRSVPVAAFLELEAAVRSGVFTLLILAGIVMRYQHQLVYVAHHWCATLMML
jgi:hypothetical protein